MSDSSPNKPGPTFVHFQWEDPESGVRLYTDLSTDTPFVGGTYLATPALEVTLPRQVGTLGEESASIVLPVDDFTLPLSGEEPFSDRILVDVWEDRGEGMPHHLYHGAVSEVVRNYGGRPEQVRVRAVTWREELEHALGLQARENCVWAFGGAGCEVDIAALEQTGTFSSASGLSAEILGLTQPPLDPEVDRYWHRGWVKRRGIRIRIRDWSPGASSTFLLGQPPPAEWIGQDVQVVPGCDKRRVVCDLRHSNLLRFMGSGAAMLAYNPVIEEGI